MHKILEDLMRKRKILKEILIGIAVVFVFYELNRFVSSLAFRSSRTRTSSLSIRD